MQKLFASDFDGTIHYWNEDPRFRPEDSEAIRAFQATGGLFGVCTGRPLKGLTKQIDTDLEFDISFDFYIGTSGGTAFDRDRQPIFRRDVPREVVEALADRYAKQARTFETGLHMGLVVGDDSYWILGKSELAPKDIMGNDMRIVESLDDVDLPFGGYSIETVTVEDATQFAAEINAEFGDVVQAFQNLDSVDVVPAGCSKGTGLEEVARYYGADLTGGIGDSYNDLPLLEAADFGYTFHRSPETMHPVADVLVDSVAEALSDYMGR